MGEIFKPYDDLVNSLILQARKGDQEAFEELLGMYTPLIRSFANRFVLDASASVQDTEDFKQELTVVFYNAILSYDIEQKGVSFGLYAKICMNNFFITQLRALKKRLDAEFVPFDADDDEVAEVGGKMTEDPAKAFMRREEFREMNKKIENALSDFENKVWGYYLSGCSSREIAEELGRTEKSIENAIFRIRNKLKGLFS